MKTSTFWISLLIFWGASGLAKAQERHQMSLEQCLEYAYQNRIELKKSAVEVEIARAKVRETTGIGLPQINGQAQFIHNYAIQTQFLPAVFFADDPNNVPADAPPVPVRFGVDYSASVGLTVNQIIFNGSYLVGLQASRTYRELSVRQQEATKVEVADVVSKAYFSLLVAKERFQLLEQNLQRLDSLLRETKVLQENGFAEVIDVNRIEVSYNNLRVEKQKTERLIGLSTELLKFQMNMPESDFLEITGTISDYQNTIVSNDMAKTNYQNRPEYKVLETATRLQQLELKNQKTNYYPSLVAFANLGFNSGANQFSQLGDFKNNWFEFGLIGLQLNVPIFDGLQRENKIQQSKLELQKLEYDRQNLERTIDFQTRQAQISYRNAVETLEIERRNIALAQEVVRVSRIKYQQGVGSNLEVLNAETSFKEAETNYYAALYDALIAKIDLDKASGNLGK
jgi:outer membrane protein TolC